jgi:hypothetical protein
MRRPHWPMSTPSPTTWTAPSPETGGLTFPAVASSAPSGPSPLGTNAGVIGLSPTLLLADEKLSAGLAISGDSVGATSTRGTPGSVVERACGAGAAGAGLP